MNRVFLTLLITILSTFAVAQSLLVENHRGKQQKIPVGRVVTVPSDSLNADPFHFPDKSDPNVMNWCRKGCYTLLSVDTILNEFRIQRADSVILSYKIEEVKSIYFVRAKHPKGVKYLRIALAAVGSIVIGQTLATGSGYSDETKLGYYALGAALIGYSLLDKRNEPKKYKLLGVIN